MYVDPKADFAKDIDQFFVLLKQHGETPEAFFKDFAILSQFALSKSKEGLAASAMPGLHLAVEKARGVKCPRCWQWTQAKNQHDLCDRCAAIVKTWKELV
jgi:isoleucyl-tRNA synthetase